MREWVQAWERAGKELEAMRVQELETFKTPLAESIQAFDGMFEMAVRENPPRDSSGLVEQQRYFRSLKERT